MEDDRFTCDPGEVMVGFDLEKRQFQCKSLSDQLISCNNPSSEFIGRLEFDFDPESGGNIVSVDRDRCVARLNPYDLMERPDEPACDFAGGTGSSGDPYLIKDVYDLQCMHISPTAHYRLSNDIDASVTSTWNSSWWTNEAQDTFTFSITSSMRGGDGFFPIRVFSGSFDGAGFRISNLDIDRTMNDVALFGEASGAVIKNVELKDFDVRNGGGNYRLNTAFLIGDDRSGSSISDVVVDGGTIEGADEVGALAGEGKDTTFSNVEVTGVDITCDLSLIHISEPTRRM